MCVTSPNYPSNYNNNEACSIRANFAAALEVTAFSTESGYDELTIGSSTYGGISGPAGVIVDTNTPISWSSDGSDTRSGWRICQGA